MSGNRTSIGSQKHTNRITKLFEGCDAVLFSKGVTFHCKLLEHRNGSFEGYHF